MDVDDDWLSRARRVSVGNDAGEGIINSQLICLEAGAGFAGDSLPAMRASAF